MTSVREEVQVVKRDLMAKSTRLVQELRELDRAIALIDYMNTENHQLRAYIQSTNRRQREVVSVPPSHPHKRVFSPTFSEEGEISNM